MSHPTTYLITALDEAGMLSLAAALANLIHRQHEGAILYLSGELGAGKTTFVRGFMRGLGYADKVKSPTYTIVEHYELADLNVWHIDLYRLQQAAEWPHLGLADCFAPLAITLIEWPELAAPLLPLPDLACKIDFVSAGRSLHFAAQTPKGSLILEKLESSRVD